MLVFPQFYRLHKCGALFPLPGTDIDWHSKSYQFILLQLELGSIIFNHYFICVTVLSVWFLTTNSLSIIIIALSSFPVTLIRTNIPIQLLISAAQVSSLNHAFTLLGGWWLDWGKGERGGWWLEENSIVKHHQSHSPMYMVRGVGM